MGSFVVKRKNFIFKTLALLALSCGVAAGAKQVYMLLTDGFSLGNITTNHVDSPEWETSPLSPREWAEVDLALSQEYTYLGKGHQAYAFESKDRKYVLKFLKFQVYRYFSVVAKMPLPAAWEQWRTRKLTRKGEKRDDVFRSWKLAFEDLKDETGVIYIHINRTREFKKSIKLYNKAGFPYILPLDDYVFMVQRKADLIEDVFARSAHSHQIEEGKKLIDDMLALYISEYQRGLAEKDRYIVRNTGVYDGKPMHIDTGRLSKDEALKDVKLQHPQLVWKTSVMLEWLREEYPQFAEHLAARLKDLEHR